MGIAIVKTHEKAVSTILPTGNNSYIFLFLRIFLWRKGYNAVSKHSSIFNKILIIYRDNIQNRPRSFLQIRKKVTGRSPVKGCSDDYFCLVIRNHSFKRQGVDFGVFFGSAIEIRAGSDVNKAEFFIESAHAGALEARTSRVISHIPAARAASVCAAIRADAT